MQHRRPPVPVIVLIVIVLLIGGYYGIRYLNDSSNGALRASGSIEATSVSVSPDLAGKVAAVLVEDGQFIQAGDVLFRQDDSLLQAERQAAAAGVVTARSAAETAQAAYDSAQIQYEIAVSTARAADRNNRIVDWIGRRPDYFDQPDWYFTREEQIIAAQVEVQAATVDLQEARANLEKVVGDLDNAQFLVTEQSLANVRSAYLVAKDASERAQISEQKVAPEDLDLQCPPFAPCYRIKIGVAKTVSGQDEDLLDVAQEQFDAAKAELEETQKAYNDLLSTEAAGEVMNARAKLAFALERLGLAQDRLTALQTGEESLAVTAAAQAVEQAKAAAAQARNAVEQASAQLDLIDTRIEKLTVHAPMDGVVLTRNIEPGEFVQPGATALTLADLSNLIITVYVPEDRYGQIRLGQPAQVTVDSFPSVTFQAEVVHIADQAEYTPRNVQTVEGRSSTVYAIKLKVADAEGRLKIGMPADVNFGE